MVALLIHVESSIIPKEGILKRGTYLSTHGILERVLIHFQDKLSRIGQVKVFGFPAHSPRCRRQTIESFWNAGRNIDPNNVINVRYTDQSNWGILPWCKDTAQIWRRSPENWWDYEQMGQRRL